MAGVAGGVVYIALGAVMVIRFGLPAVIVGVAGTSLTVTVIAFEAALMQPADVTVAV